MRNGLKIVGSLSQKSFEVHLKIANRFEYKVLTLTISMPCNSF